MADLLPFKHAQTTLQGVCATFTEPPRLRWTFTGMAESIGGELSSEFACMKTFGCLSIRPSGHGSQTSQPL
ncbi:hypothetical protein CERSUDRAFT_79695 [Gelatoporia subvermispora B]|uniref:Uncharacterized protein n=1 Tax=Ceriporiopsis subvermispora (strain B) TaxID=914234 RepID=M2PYU8_CERS8|nr:hypothetical protein CERSUDRAFT_79695 [Gelatoporia subvermispora B]